MLLGHVRSKEGPREYRHDVDVTPNSIRFTTHDWGRRNHAEIQIMRGTCRIGSGEGPGVTARLEQDVIVEGLRCLLRCDLFNSTRRK